MKKIYSDADKTDLPLDSQKSGAISADGKAKKAKINVISTKKINTKKQKEENSAPKEDRKTKLRTKLKSDSYDLMDLEKLNEENIKSRGYRGRRNRVIIIVLSVLLALVIASIAIYLSMIKINYNCTLKIKGDVSAVYLVDGEELSEFKVPATIRGDRVLRLDTDVQINSGGAYMVSFIVEVYQGSLKLGGIQLTGVNTYLFELASDGVSYVSRDYIVGNQTISLFTGVAIDAEYENTLNSNNFKMVVTTNFVRV